MSPDALDFLWQCADSPVAVPLVTADDVAVLSPQDLRSLLDIAVLRPADTVQYIECRDCGEDHMTEVTRAVSPDATVRFFAVCPAIGRAEIPPGRLLQWAVHFGPLLTVIKAGFGLPGPAKEVVSGRVWDLGRVALAGQSRPLWSVRGMSWPDAGAVAVALPEGRSPVVLFLGTAPGPGVLAVPCDSAIDLRTVVRLDAGALAVASEAVESQLRGSPPAAAAKGARRRASRAAGIDSIKQALRVHLRAARDHAFDTDKRLDKPELLPRPTQKQLAQQLGLSVSSVSRAVHDSNDREILILWETANDVDRVMKFKR